MAIAGLIHRYDEDDEQEATRTSLMIAIMHVIMITSVTAGSESFWLVVAHLEMVVCTLACLLA